MRTEAHTDVATTPPLNSAAEFRKELAALQAQEQQQINETENGQDISEPAVEADNQDTEPPADHSEGSSVSADDSVDTTAVDDDDLLDTRAPVPVKRLKKEIEKRHAIEEQLRREREEKIRFQTELDLINKAMASLHNPQGQQESSTDKFDPIDDEAHRYYTQQYSHQDQKIGSLEQELRTLKMEQTLRSQEEMFSKQQPDFREAYVHLIKTETEANKYIAKDENEAQMMAAYKLRNMAEVALNQGKNVAEVFYKMAKSYGYSSKPTKAAPNLNAIETNMRKSKVADVPTTPLVPSNGAGNYTTLENFERFYSGSSKEKVDKFHQALKALRSNR